MKCLNNIDRLKISNETLRMLLELYEFRGKDYYFEQVLKSNLSHMKRETIEKDTFYLVEMMNIEATNNRKKLIILKDSEPKNKNEQLISNIKATFSIISEKIDQFELNSNEILSLAHKLYDGYEKVSYVSYTVDTNDSLIKKKKVSKREEMEVLLNQYNRLIRAKKHEITQLVTNFYIDFIHLAPFTTGNKYIGLLIICILLLKEKFKMFHYVSFFSMLYENLEEFYNKEAEASFNYEYGFSNTDSLNNLIISMLLDGYRRIDNMAKNTSIDSLISKASSIENTIFRLPQVFTKDDIRRLHPYASMSTIDRTLKKLRDEGRIRPNGVGRSASWIRLEDIERFEILDDKKASLFDNFLDND